MDERDRITLAFVRYFFFVVMPVCILMLAFFKPLREDVFGPDYVFQGKSYPWYRLYP